MTVADIVKQNKANCCGCYGCENICPTNAVSFENDEEGFWYPQVDENLCVQCGKCVEVCPCKNVPKTLQVEHTLACNAKEKQELMSSSSGGVFAVMARAVLKKGGYACGAAFDKDFSVAHRIIDSEDQLGELKGTKYVQSKIGSVYTEIKELLKQEKFVLFSGTPCQVAGLKAFLKHDYDSLITVDLICHGVPSPEIWQEYLKEISAEDRIVEVNFRNKENGIDNATIDFTFESGKKRQCRYAEDPFVKGFLNNYFLRPSCFECKFKGLKRCSDITIGDFWAIKEFYPDFDSAYGTSAVIIKTEKAENLMSAVLDKFNTINVKAECLYVWNESLLKPAKRPRNRTAFYERRGNETITYIVCDLYASDADKKGNSSLWNRIKNILYRG